MMVAITILNNNKNMYKRVYMYKSAHGDDDGTFLKKEALVGQKQYF